MAEGNQVPENSVDVNASKRPGPGVLEGTRTQARINGIEEKKPLTREEFLKGEFLRQFDKTGTFDRKKATAEANIDPQEQKERMEEERARALEWKYTGGQQKETPMRAEDTVPILERINKEREEGKFNQADNQQQEKPAVQSTTKDSNVPPVKTELDKNVGDQELADRISREKAEGTAPAENAGKSSTPEKKTEGETLGSEGGAKDKAQAAVRETESQPKTILEAIDAEVEAEIAKIKLNHEEKGKKLSEYDEFVTKYYLTKDKCLGKLGYKAKDIGGGRIGLPGLLGKIRILDERGKEIRSLDDGHPIEFDGHWESQAGMRRLWADRIDINKDIRLISFLRRRLGEKPIVPEAEPVVPSAPKAETIQPTAPKVSEVAAPVKKPEPVNVTVSVQEKHLTAEEITARINAANKKREENTSPLNPLGYSEKPTVAPAKLETTAASAETSNEKIQEFNEAQLGVTTPFSAQEIAETTSVPTPTETAPTTPVKETPWHKKILGIFKPKKVQTPGATFLETPLSMAAFNMPETERKQNAVKQFVKTVGEAFDYRGALGIKEGLALFEKQRNKNVTASEGGKPTTEPQPPTLSETPEGVKVKSAFEQLKNNLGLTETRRVTNQLIDSLKNQLNKGKQSLKEILSDELKNGPILNRLRKPSESILPTEEPNELTQEYNESLIGEVTPFSEQEIAEALATMPTTLEPAVPGGTPKEAFDATAQAEAEEQKWSPAWLKSKLQDIDNGNTPSEKTPELVEYLKNSTFHYSEEDIAKMKPEEAWLNAAVFCTGFEQQKANKAWTERMESKNELREAGNKRRETKDAWDKDIFNETAKSAHEEAVRSFNSLVEQEELYKASQVAKDLKDRIWRKAADAIPETPTATGEQTPAVVSAGAPKPGKEVAPSTAVSAEQEEQIVKAQVPGADQTEKPVVPLIPVVATTARVEVPVQPASTESVPTVNPVVTPAGKLAEAGFDTSIQTEKRPELGGRSYEELRLEAEGKTYEELMQKPTWEMNADELTRARDLLEGKFPEDKRLEAFREAGKTAEKAIEADLKDGRYADNVITPKDRMEARLNALQEVQAKWEAEEANKNTPAAVKEREDKKYFESLGYTVKTGKNAKGTPLIFLRDKEKKLLGNEGFNTKLNNVKFGFFNFSGAREYLEEKQKFEDYLKQSSGGSFRIAESKSGNRLILLRDKDGKDLNIDPSDKSQRGFFNFYDAREYLEKQAEQAETSRETAAPSPAEKPIKAIKDMNLGELEDFEQQELDKAIELMHEEISQNPDAEKVRSRVFGEAMRRTEEEIDDMPEAERAEYISEENKLNHSRLHVRKLEKVFEEYKADPENFFRSTEILDAAALGKEAEKPAKVEVIPIFKIKNPLTEGIELRKVKLKINGKDSGMTWRQHRDLEKAGESYKDGQFYLDFKDIVSAKRLKILPGTRFMILDRASKYTIGITGGKNTEVKISDLRNLQNKEHIAFYLETNESEDWKSHNKFFDKQAGKASFFYPKAPPEVAITRNLSIKKAFNSFKEASRQTQSEEDLAAKANLFEQVEATQHGGKVVSQETPGKTLEGKTEEGELTEVQKAEVKYASANEAWKKAISEYREAMMGYEPYKIAHENWILAHGAYRTALVGSKLEEDAFNVTELGEKLLEKRNRLSRIDDKAEAAFNATELGKKLYEEKNKLSKIDDEAKAAVADADAAALVEKNKKIELTTPGKKKVDTTQTAKTEEVVELTEVQKAEEAYENADKAQRIASGVYEEALGLNLNKNESYVAKVKDRDEALAVFENALAESGLEQEDFKTTLKGADLFAQKDRLWKEQYALEKQLKEAFETTPEGADLFAQKDRLWKTLPALHAQLEEALGIVKVKTATQIPTASSPATVPVAQTFTPVVPDETKKPVEPPSKENKTEAQKLEEELQALLRGLPGQPTTPSAEENKLPETGGEPKLSADEQRRLKDKQRLDGLDDLFDKPPTEQPDQGDSPKP